MRLGIAHVPEGRRVFPGLSVRENIMLGASNGKTPRGEIRSEADAMFDLFPDIRPFAECARLDVVGRTATDGRRCRAG